MAKEDKNSVVIKNKRASYDYEFISEEIAGISLMGSEIKSLREGDASIKEAHCYIQDEEMFITGMHIAEYKQSGGRGHEPLRLRKLLLTKKQIRTFDKKLVKGLTIVPVRLFINAKGLAKLKIALAKGKKKFDKRNSIKERDVQRDIDREIKG